jgi:prepilin-type N-terminal cleavage/methylation domain-containing protein
MSGNREHFTLIELLVVVAIIAVLVSLLVPALSGAREQAQLVVCASNQKQIYLGIAVYASDFDSFLPPALPYITLFNPSTYMTFRLNDESSPGNLLPTGLGYLFTTGALNDGAVKLLFCPSWEGQQDSQYNCEQWFDNLHREIFDEGRGFSEITSAYRGTSTVYGPTENDTFNPGGRFNQSKISMRMTDDYYKEHPVILMDHMQDIFNPWRGYGGGRTHKGELNNLTRFDGSINTMSVMSIYDVCNTWSNVRNYQLDFNIWDLSKDLE